MSEEGRLSTAADWSERWGTQNPGHLWRIRPKWPEFRDLHRLFKRHLPAGRSYRFLEVGCYPGGHMLYFAEQFEYRVSGLEYVSWCAESTKTALRKEGIEADIICADLFTFEIGDAPRWHVVASVGFVEHFANVEPVVKRHLGLVEPGGWLVLIIPNHAGIYGRIVKRLAPEKHRMHNLMDYEALREAVVTCGGEIVEGGYYGHFGFWNTGIYQHVKACHPRLYYAVRGVLLMTEWLGQLLPNFRQLAPMAAVIARTPKRDSSNRARRD